MKRICLLFISVLIIAHARTQIAINNTGNVAAGSSILDISSTNKGLLIPRVTSAQRNAIANPETGLLVFDMDRTTLFMYDGVQWRPLSFSSEKKLPLIERTPVTNDKNVRFGQDVAISGEYAIVGAPEEDSLNFGSSGFAYIYHRENNIWKLQQKIFPSVAQTITSFGWSVAIENDIAVVGAPYAIAGGQSLSGNVFVFKRNGNVWAQQQLLQLTSPQIKANFGNDVAIQNGRILVGVKGHTVNGFQNAGSAYLYEYIGNSWGATKNFKPSNAVTDGFFGSAVSLYNNEVAIGAPGAYYNGIKSGLAYVFSYNGGTGTWTESILHAQFPKENAQMGLSICIYNDFMQSGSPVEEVDIQGSKLPGVGVLSSFKKTGGVWAYFGGSTGKYEDGFYGYSVAFNDQFFLRGVPFYDNSRGYVQSANNYADIDNDAFTNFGFSVAISGNYFIIGSPEKNSGKGSVMFGRFE